MSTIKADAIEAATGTNTDLVLTGKGTGVPDIETGFKVSGTAGLPVSDLRVGTDGELITWDASGNPTTVAVGTAAQVLTSNGAGAAPTFQDAAGGAWTFIASATASASATVEFNNQLDSTYDVYKLFIVGLTPATDGTSLYLRVRQSDVSQSGAGAYEWRYGASYASVAYGTSNESTSDTEIEIAFGIGGEGLSNITGEFLHGEITCYRPSDTTGKKAFLLDIWSENQNNRDMHWVGSGNFAGNNSAIDGIDFRMSSGNITVGDFYLYGLNKS